MQHLTNVRGSSSIETCRISNIGFDLRVCIQPNPLRIHKYLVFSYLDDAFVFHAHRYKVFLPPFEAGLNCQFA